MYNKYYFPRSWWGFHTTSVNFFQPLYFPLGNASLSLGKAVSNYIALISTDNGLCSWPRWKDQKSYAPGHKMVQEHAYEPNRISHLLFFFFLRLIWVSERQSNSHQWVLNYPKALFFTNEKWWDKNEANLLECRDRGNWKGNKLHPNPLPAKAEGNEWERGQHIPAEVFPVTFPSIVGLNLVYEKCTKAAEVKEWNLDLIL